MWESTSFRSLLNAYKHAVRPLLMWMASSLNINSCPLIIAISCYHRHPLPPTFLCHQFPPTNNTLPTPNPFCYRHFFIAKISLPLKPLYYRHLSSAKTTLSSPAIPLYCRPLSATNPLPHQHPSARNTTLHARVSFSFMKDWKL